MRLLLIDTCSEVGSAALADGSHVVASIELPARSASASLLTGIRAMLGNANWTIQGLQGVGVVNGPGSFTGLRVGLACAKGICEAIDVPLAAVSRLEVLAASAGRRTGYAVLSAGREEVFVLDIAANQQMLLSIEQCKYVVQDAPVLVAEEALVPKLQGCFVEMCAIHARESLALVLERMRDAREDVVTVDANYIRGEQHIYGAVLASKVIAE